jgi:hypothetical protein
VRHLVRDKGEKNEHTHTHTHTRVSLSLKEEMAGEGGLARSTRVRPSTISFACFWRHKKPSEPIKMTGYDENRLKALTNRLMYFQHE